MLSEKIHFKQNDDSVIRILEETEQFAYDIDMSDKAMLRLRLLAEELVSLVNSMSMEFEADYWVESKDGVIDLHMDLQALMTPERRRELISLSSSGKNAEPVGILGKIRGMIENVMLAVDENDQMVMARTVPYAMYGMSDSSGIQMMENVTIWSLQRYRDNVADEDDSKEALKVAKDELEKSVIANLADDVSVGIKDSNVRLVVSKRF
ncbi:MAG TPA: hypothetical protein DCP06_04430 [Lachnospiraceae bacterium]|nr:hypothetical protein [Lachnospiraceae bacterium]